MLLCRELSRRCHVSSRMARTQFLKLAYGCHNVVQCVFLKCMHCGFIEMFLTNNKFWIHFFTVAIPSMCIKRWKKSTPQYRPAILHPALTAQKCFSRRCNNVHKNGTVLEQLGHMQPSPLYTNTPILWALHI
jgi:hypothetical protein